MACTDLSARFALAAALALGPAAWAATPDSEALEFFESRIRPLLVDECYSCHSAEAGRLRGDLLLDSKAGWEKGGASGKPALVPGDPDASLLIQAVRRTHEDLAMPPEKPLSEDQIAALEAWVRMGAPDPRTDPAHAPPPDPDQLAAGHWAFQPIRATTPPAVRNSDWPRTPIDQFILAALEENGLQPAPRADRRTLIRRASFVLTGLPPAHEEVVAFESDPDDDDTAFARVIDRLLASPRYGERWGRHWLDVARYADTKGYVFEEERLYPYAYTYRDYVIQAFNDDKPYDQFLIEQIAADRLGDDGDRSALAAMGFLTLGRRFLNNQHDIIDDRIDVLTRGTMALTVACARCHDHKYDPIPTADYYSLYGVFASSEEPAEKPLLGTIPDPVRYEAFKAELQQKEKELEDFIRTKEEEYRKRLREGVGDYLVAARAARGLDRDKQEELARSRKLSPKVLRDWISAIDAWAEKPHPVFGPWIELSRLPDEGFADAARAVIAEMAEAGAGDSKCSPAVLEALQERPPASIDDLGALYNQLFTEAADDSIREFLAASGTPLDLSEAELHRLFDVADGQRKRALQRAIDRLHATHPGAPPRAMALVDRDTPVEPVVFRRGNPGNRGDTVPRQFLKVIAGPDRKPFSDGSGRLELARAIASRDNPLTARVAVNRVWLHHFGNGLVRTPADFGLRSEPPTHPELLDWLAVEFMDHGWSFKHLHRLILMSATWQQSSDASPDAALKDPDNRLLSHQNRRRLDFEAMRDSLLHASGRLDLEMGGHAVEIAERDYKPRRTIYGMVERQNLPAMFRTFDFASPDTTTAQRFQTTVPQQALFYMNSPFAMDQARSIMNRPDVAGVIEPEQRIRRLYRIVLQRDPDEHELALGSRFVANEQLRPAPESDPAPVWQYGFGRVNRESGNVEDFTPLPHFTGSAWQGGPELPDPKLGWFILNAEGGHSGPPSLGAVVRRWTAPRDATVEVRGRLSHEATAGDGVRALIVSSRHGILGEWEVHADSTRTHVAHIRVARGDTLDFAVECRENQNSDSFRWAPTIRAVEAGGASSPAEWNARADFGGPVEPPTPLGTWERYAQVLLMSNEAVFID